MNNHKRSVFEASLSTGKKVQVFIVPGGDLEIPKEAFVDEKGEPKAFTFLEYGLDMPIPIPDLESDHDGIRATLTFWDDTKATFVPWSNIGMILIVGSGFTAVWNTPVGASSAETSAYELPKRPQLTLV